MAMKADTTDLQTKDFTTRSCNMWKTDEASIYPEAASCADGEETASLY